MKNNSVHSSEEKKSYSLRELIPGIMEYEKPPKGLTYSEYYPTFDADYKRIQRLVRAIEKTTGNNDGFKKITAKNKEGFVAMTTLLRKELFDNPSPTPLQQSIAKKINQGKDLIDDELTYLIDAFRNIIDAHMNLEDRDLLLRKIEKSNSYYKWRDEIIESFLADIHLIEGIEHPLRQKMMMDKFTEIFEEGQYLIDFRESIKETILMEEKIKQVVYYAEKLGLDHEPILTGEDEEGIKIVTLAMSFADNNR